jgi:Tfp pilus assembly protein PilF
LNLALLLIRQNRADEALFQLREMTRYYQLQSNADRSVVEMAHVAIAVMMLKNQHPDLAIEACHEALAIDPNDQRAIKLLARAQQSIAPPTTLPQRAS